MDEEAEHSTSQSFAFPGDRRPDLLFRPGAGRPPQRSLTPGALHRDDDIAEQAGRQVVERSLPHRKGQNVGGSLLPPVAAVDLSHFAVIDQENAQLLSRTALNF